MQAKTSRNHYAPCNSTDGLTMMTRPLLLLALLSLPLAGFASSFAGTSAG